MGSINFYFVYVAYGPRPQLHYFPLGVHSLNHQNELPHHNWAFREGFTPFCQPMS